MIVGEQEADIIDDHVDALREEADGRDHVGVGGDRAERERRAGGEVVDQLDHRRALGAAIEPAGPERSGLDQLGRVAALLRQLEPEDPVGDHRHSDSRAIHSVAFARRRRAEGLVALGEHRACGEERVVGRRDAADPHERVQLGKARGVDPALHAPQIGQRQLDVEARVNQLAERCAGGEAHFNVDQIIGARRARPRDGDCDGDYDQAGREQAGEQAEPGCESGGGPRLGHAPHGNQPPAAGEPCDRLSFVIRDRTTPTAFRGFPWWLPLITALVGAIIALAVAGSATASWVVDVRLWVRSDVSQSAALSDALRDPEVLQTTLDLNGSD